MISETYTLIENSILVVDDNPDNLELLKEILLKAGYIVNTAYNGESALNSVKNNCPVLILLDIMMPDINGYEICHLLKSDKKTEKIPIIFISALDDKKSKTKGLEVGGIDFITKPFFNGEVLARVKTHISIRQMQLNLELQNRELSKEINERKLAEKKILKLNEELENRVKERTRQLEAANKELESFCYSVSHDLRAPLRAMNSFAIILINEYSQTLSDEAIRYLSKITENAKKMSILIDNLLKLSHLNKKEIVFSKINMYELADNVYNELHSLSEKDFIDFRLTQIPDAYGELSLMRQVWTNLIENAIKFTFKKTERIIEIGFQQNDFENIYYVKDNGAGFNMEYSKKLFAVFERLHNNNEFKGTGVGLAIVERIISRHNGKIWAESETDKGAVFFFSLPIDFKAL